LATGAGLRCTRRLEIFGLYSRARQFIDPGVPGHIPALILLARFAPNAFLLPGAEHKYLTMQ
jgi:hypothetical protein